MAVVLQVNNSAVSSFLEAKGSVLQVINMCLPTGASRSLVAPTWLWNTIPECPVLNPGLHFCPEESRNAKGCQYLRLWLSQGVRNLMVLTKKEVQEQRT